MSGLASKGHLCMRSSHNLRTASLILLQNSYSFHPKISSVLIVIVTQWPSAPYVEEHRIVQHSASVKTG